MGLSSLFASRFVQQISSWRTVLLQQRAKDDKAYQRRFGHGRHAFIRKAGRRCLLLADFVAEVGDDKSVAAGSNVLS
jgi:hypothetical protein